MEEATQGLVSNLFCSDRSDQDKIQDWLQCIQETASFDTE